MPTSAQLLGGRVLEAGTDNPAAAAEVALLGAGRTLLTTQPDSSGVFQLVPPRPGRYSLRVERLGYVSAEIDTVTMSRGEVVEVEIRLNVTAVQLPPIIVVDRRGPIGARAGFHRRLESGQRTGYGRFITREALDSAAVPHITSLLARVPLVGIVYDEERRPHPVMQARGGCRPALYLNGARFEPGPHEGIDDMIGPRQLEGIEIYRYRSELPPEFAGPRDCGAIVFWTRAGETGGGGRWRFIAGGGLLLAMAVLFVIR